MKKLFLTTALIFPLAVSPVLAQQATVPPPGQGATQDTVTDPAADATTGAGAMDAANDATPDAATDAADAAGGADATADIPDAAGNASDAAADAAAEAEAAASDAAVVTDPDKVVQEQAANELRLDWVTGATVTSPDGETIGSVSDLILDRDSGRMAAAVIGVGGFLGIGEKKIAVPWDRLVINSDANQITSDLSRAEADAAPEYVFRPREPLAPLPADTGLPPVAPAPVQ